MAASYETFEAALGRPIDSVEVARVIAALGGRYEVRTLSQGTGAYDPDYARTVAWDFSSAPRASRFFATNLGVTRRHGCLDDSRPVAGRRLDQRSPRLFQAARRHSLVLQTVERGRRVALRPCHREARGRVPARPLCAAGALGRRYKFPLTPRQVETLQADLLTYREVWEGLLRICQSRRFFDDPSTLPADAQALINARCGRD